MVGEPSWSAIERGWNLINACLETDRANVVVYETHRYEKGGYVWFNDDPVYCCLATPEDVGRTVRDVIDRPRLEMIREEPSHT